MPTKLVFFPVGPLDRLPESMRMAVSLRDGGPVLGLPCSLWPGDALKTILGTALMSAKVLRRPVRKWSAGVLIGQSSLGIERPKAPLSLVVSRMVGGLDSI